MKGEKMDSNLLNYLDSIIQEKLMVCISLQTPIYDYMITTHIYYYTLSDDGMELYVENDDMITIYNLDLEISCDDEECVIMQSGSQIVISPL